MQTFISPAARELKKVMNARQYSGALWQLQKTLLEGSNNDLKVRRELQQSMKAMQKSEYTKEVLQDYFKKSSLNKYGQPDSLHPRKQFAQQNKKEDQDAQNEEEIGSDDDLSSIGDVSGSVRFSTNDKNLAENPDDKSSFSENEEDEIGIADQLPTEDELAEETKAPQ